MKTIVIWIVSIFAVLVAAYGIRYGALLLDGNVGTYENLSASEYGVTGEEKSDFKIKAKFSFNLEGMGYSYNDGEFKGECSWTENGISATPEKGVTKRAKALLEIQKGLSKYNSIIEKDKTFSAREKGFVEMNQRLSPMDNSISVATARAFIKRDGFLLDEKTKINADVSGELEVNKKTNCDITLAFSQKSNENISFNDTVISLTDDGKVVYSGGYGSEEQKISYEYYGKYEIKENYIVLKMNNGIQIKNDKENKISVEETIAIYLDAGSAYTGVYKKK